MKGNKHHNSDEYKTFISQFLNTKEDVENIKNLKHKLSMRLKTVLKK